MSRTFQRITRLLALAVTLPILLTGCAAAAGGAAGAAATIAYTERGASSQVDASVDDVVAATESVFAERGISIESREIEEGGSEVELQARTGDMEIGVEIERDDARTSQIEVYAHEDVVRFDREYAQDLLQQIIDRL